MADEKSLSVEQRIAPLLARASAKTRTLVANDTYLKTIFTDPSLVFDKRPLGMGSAGELKVGEAAQLYVPANAVEVSCTAIPRDNLAVILSAGQSNATGNTPDDELYTPKARFYELNRDDGQCYVANSPLPGNGGSHGTSFPVPLGDDLIAGGLFKNVLIVPIAVGGTYLEEWTPNGRYFDRFASALDLLAGMGLSPTFVLWHQGEGNAAAMLTAKSAGMFGIGTGSRPILVNQDLRDAVRIAYVKHFLEIVKALRDRGVAAPVFVAKATTCGAPRTEPSIRAAQQELPDRVWGIFPGPDTDQIDFRHRWDYCHFDLAGQQQHARLWASTIAGFLGRPLNLPALPNCALTLQPEAIKAGGRSILAWTTTGAISASIDQGLGTSLSLSDKTVVTARVPTTYTLTAVDNDGARFRCRALLKIQ